MAKQQIKLALGWIVIVGWLFWLWGSINPTPPFDPAQHVALGQVVAEESLKLLGPGGRFILILRDAGTFQSPATDVHKRTFLKTVTAAKAQVASTLSVKVDPLRVPAVPPGDLLRILKEAKDGDVIVSFAGPPVFSEAQMGKLGGKFPKMVAVCTGAIPKQVDLGSILKRGVLSLAILDREGAAKPIQAIRDERGLFDRYYQLATPSTWALVTEGKAL